MNDTLSFSKIRRRFHLDLLDSILVVDTDGTSSNADKSSKPSIAIARGIFERLNDPGTITMVDTLPVAQRAGTRFEEICRDYLLGTFPHLSHLRPGHWDIKKGANIEQFDQYEHLSELANVSKDNPQLAAVLGSDYLIKPDVVVIRLPEKDSAINTGKVLIDDAPAHYTPLRSINNSKPILHASVSCKWTLRSDRGQNARSEALNLVRNRKGKLPHIAVVTGEPMPSRIASIALGTGDIDCVYHFALPELQETLNSLNLSKQRETLDIMIDGKRLRDISDLPFDLAI